MRHARATRVQRESRTQAAIYHLAGPAAFLRDAALRALTAPKYSRAMTGSTTRVLALMPRRPPRSANSDGFGSTGEGRERAEAQGPNAEPRAAGLLWAAGIDPGGDRVDLVRVK
jgi:hypothetical protein